MTALDLQKPSFECPRVLSVAGDVTKLEFVNNSFDCTFCAEVLEHIPNLQKACREIIRVTKHEIIVGVPFKQDIRLGRTTCLACGRTNPPWGHVNSFDESRLLRLFSGLRVVSKSFVCANKEATNPISTVLMDISGNPWGSYEQGEPCVHCGAKLVAPSIKRKIWQKVSSGLAVRMNHVQALLTRPHGNWIHLVFSKNNKAG